VAALQTFLDFAQTGRLAIAQRNGQEGQSAFEEAVRRAVESLGYEVHPQVGVAGFFIDLGVLDRERPGRYLLGIECDGVPYHSSRSARDRDRLRQAVLEDHGWIIHRIWSADWFQRPAEQLRRVADAIGRAKVVADEISRHYSPSLSAAKTIESDDGIERETALETAKLATEYSQAAFQVPSGVEPQELAKNELAEILLRIVQYEGPIHEEELLTRVRDLWGFGRAGARIQDAVAKGVRSLLVTRKCSREEGFLSIPGAAVPIRNRENVTSSNLRKPEMLPPAEIRAAILAIIDVHHGATQRELPVAVARLFGFKTTSSQLRATIESQTDKLLRQGAIEEINGMLKRVEPN
jgi:very-short-patch-repair endonuclease